jgi:hypothetical protein
VGRLLFGDGDPKMASEEVPMMYGRWA